MKKGEVSKIDVLTIVIAIIALMASISSIYFQFFNNSTELSVKFTGTNIVNDDDKFQSEISLLFLNTGNSEVALIYGFIYLSVDESSPQYYFAGDRDRLNDDKKKWITQVIDLESDALFSPGKISAKKFKFSLIQAELREYMEQNFDLKSKEEVKFHVGVSLNFIDSKGKLKTEKITPSILSLHYKIDGDSLSYYGSGANVNQAEVRQISTKYEIF